MEDELEVPRVKTVVERVALLALAAQTGACVLHVDAPDVSDASPGPDARDDAHVSDSILLAEITVGSAGLAESCAADLADFPLLVVLDNLDRLRTRDHGGIINSSTGNDLLFRAADDVTTLDYEIELYDGSTGSLVAWVRLPTLSNTSDTTVLLYGGNTSITTPSENPPGVWDSGFAGVWHLHDDFADSTAAHDDCTNHGSTTTAGQIGNGQAFDNTDDDYIDCGAGASLDITEALTLSAWVQPGSTPGTGDLFDFLSKGNVYALQFADGTLQPKVALMTPAGTWNTVIDPEVIDTTSMHYMAATYDVAGGASNAKLYVDGALANERTFTEPIASTTATLTLGRWTDARDYDGVLDEVRISNLARDACWLETQYANQVEPSAFYTLVIPASD